LKILCYVLLFTPLFLSARVQDSTAISNPRELVYDLDSHQKAPQFDDQKIEEYKTQDDFDYTEYQEPDNWWAQFKNWVTQHWNKIIKSIFGATVIAGGFWGILFQTLMYLLVIGVLFLLGWLFMKVNPASILLEKQLAPQIELTEDEDIIQNQDIQQLIDQALQHKNYRLAIRYYYLFVLKKLSDAELIEWEAQKTNTDYSKELTDDTVQYQFKAITRLYDFIWYGNFEVNETLYQKAEKEFKSITHLIQP
jgi:hypothetical protein